MSRAVAVIPLVYARNVVAMRPGVEGWWEFGKSWSNFADLTVSRPTLAIRPTDPLFLSCDIDV